MKIKQPFGPSFASPWPTLVLSFAAATGLFGGSRLEAKESDMPTPATAPARREESAPVPTAQQDSPHTFWKHPDYDAVLEVWNSPDRGLRGKIAYLNPADEKIKKMVGKILKKDEKQVSNDDVLSFQGMEGDLHLHPDGPNKWSGTIYWRFKEKSYGVDIEQSADKLHVHGYLLLPTSILGVPVPKIGKSVDLVPGKIPAATANNIATATNNNLAISASLLPKP